MRFLSRLFCRHSMEFKRNIYGDEIISWGWKRSKECSCLMVAVEKLTPNSAAPLGVGWNEGLGVVVPKR